MSVLNRRCTVTLKGRIIRDFMNGNADRVLAVSTDDGTTINVYLSNVELDPVEVEPGGLYSDASGNLYFGLERGNIVDTRGCEYTVPEVGDLTPLMVN